MNIRKKDILVYFVTLVFFCGNYTSMLPLIGPLLKVSNNLIFLYLAVIIVQRICRRQSLKLYSKIAIGFACFTVSYQLISAYYGDTDMVLTSIKAIVVILWLDNQIKEDNSLLIGPIMLAFWTWCIADSVFTFMHPAGVNFSVGNEYLLGGKNNKIFYFFIAEFLAGLRHIRNRNYANSEIGFTLMWILLTGMLLANVSIIESSTTSLVLILLVLYILFERIMSTLPLTKISVVLLIHIIVFFLLVFVRELFQEELNLIMQTVFQKDATLTGRIYIWRSAFILILQSPWIGYGIYKPQAAQLLSGYDYMWTMAHNQILELLMRGGAVLLSQWITIVGMLASRLRALQHNAFAKYTIFALFSVFFFYHTEATLDKISFLVFVLMYYSANYTEEAGS